uniref:Uncharacterized protein n=1 Tax=Panagrolaimus superbus TaxID=310955 RepID=A0A914YNC1_9BILA
MSGDGRSRKRNLLAGGPKSGPIRSKAPPASKVIDSSVLSAPTPAVVPDSLLPSASAAATQGRRTPEDDDDDIQILEEPKPKRRNRKKSEEEDIKESFVIPETLVIPPVNQTSKRQGTPFTAIQSRKDKKSLPLEVIPDSLAEMDEPVENPTKVLTNKRNPKQAGLDEGIGEALKAVKKIKLSTPTPSTADLKNVLLQSTIRSSPPGKIFQKARQGSFYVARPIQRIAVSEMSVWNGDK